MSNKKITKEISKEIESILKLNIDDLFDLSDEKLLDISTTIKQLDKNALGDNYERVNYLKLSIQQELYKRLKIGKHAFSISNHSGKQIVSADYIFNKMRMKHVVKPKEIEILEKWLDEKAEMQNFKAYYSLSTNSSVQQTKTYYFTFDKVLEKINNSYSKKGSSEPLVDIPLLFNQKDVFELLEIPRARFEKENLKEHIGYYQLNVSKKIAVMYSLEDLLEFTKFWNYYKQFYIVGNVVKRNLTLSVKDYYETYCKLPLKKQQEFQTPYEKFMDKIKKMR